MDCKEFANSTINRMNQQVFEQVKAELVGKFLSFSIIAEDAITKEMLAEKLCDYFEKLEYKTNKPFEKYIETYMDDLSSIVERRIEKERPAKKGEATQTVAPRARKYYKKAIKERSSRTQSISALWDYSRIMFCLYAAIIKNGFKVIENFDYAIDSLNPTAILSAMKEEKPELSKIYFKKRRFETKERYCSDTCSIIITIIMLYTIINDRVEGENSHEQ